MAFEMSCRKRSGPALAVTFQPEPSHVCAGEKGLMPPLLGRCALFSEPWFNLDLTLGLGYGAI